MVFDGKDESEIAVVIDLISMMRGDRIPLMKELLHAVSFLNWKVSKLLSETERLVR